VAADTAAAAHAALVRELEEPLACVDRESCRASGVGEGVRTRGGVKACRTVFGRDKLFNAAAVAAAAADVADENTSLWVSTAVPALPVQKMISNDERISMLMSSRGEYLQCAGARVPLTSTWGRVDRC